MNRRDFNKTLLGGLAIASAPLVAKDEPWKILGTQDLSKVLQVGDEIMVHNFWNPVDLPAYKLNPHAFSEMFIVKDSKKSGFGNDGLVLTPVFTHSFQDKMYNNTNLTYTEKRWPLNTIVYGNDTIVQFVGFGLTDAPYRHGEAKWTKMYKQEYLA